MDIAQAKEDGGVTPLAGTTMPRLATLVWPAVLLLVACAGAPMDPSIEARAATPPPGRPSPFSYWGLTEAISFSGFGQATFGGTEASLRMAWGEPLEDGGVEIEECRQLSPTPDTRGAALSFMVDGGRFVRLDMWEPKVKAPGGGHVGMTMDDLRQAYPTGVVSAHKYDDDGQYLEVPDPSSAERALVFEVNGQGEVHTWRIGQRPHVTYVEGCA